ncbi:hypothetical protein MPER_07048 [Moniliophthora perniciosa FA553]|nr:hypothetical protein MPER_07048 [Moniliophthora perniciosa FA553]
MGQCGKWYFCKDKLLSSIKIMGWGMSHAFFTIMGGFTLYDGDKFHGYLWNDRDRIYSQDSKPWFYFQEEAKEYIKQIKMHIQKIQDHSPQENTLMSNAEGSNQREESINLLVYSHLYGHWNALLKSTSLQEKGTPEPPCLLEYFLQKGYITITEDEIKDRSHADFITKSIALIQTTWFILQVAARAAEGLTVTKLEIITDLHFSILAHTSCGGINHYGSSILFGSLGGSRNCQLLS